MITNDIWTIHAHNSFNAKIDAIRTLKDLLKEFKMIDYIYSVVTAKRSSKLLPDITYFLLMGLSKDSKEDLSDIFVSDIRSDKKYEDTEINSFHWLSSMGILTDANSGKFTALGRMTLKLFCPHYRKYLSLNRILNLVLILILIMIGIGMALLVSIMIYHFLDPAIVAHTHYIPYKATLIICNVPLLGWLDAMIFRYCIMGHRILFSCLQDDTSEKRFLICWLSALNTKNIDINVESFNVDHFINFLKYGLFMNY